MRRRLRSSRRRADALNNLGLTLMALRAARPKRWRSSDAALGRRSTNRSAHFIIALMRSLNLAPSKRRSRATAMLTAKSRCTPTR